VSQWQGLEEMLLGPPSFPRRPLLLARFGLHAMLSARAVARRWFKDQRGRALFAGLAAHSALPLERPITAAFGLVLGVAGHAVGWPLAAGGSQRITDALVGYLRSLGGEVFTNSAVQSLDEVPGSRTILLDVTPRQLLRIAGNRHAGRNRRRGARAVGERSRAAPFRAARPAYSV
jgi:phytoene dehydrogenase-like protein